MANTKQTKKYLGGWDTSAYDDLSRASRQAYATNWDILKDRFNNLMAEADAKQQEAVRNYNNTLANQTNAAFNAQRAIDQNLSNRGLAESGVRSLANQEQTRAIGGSTNAALGKLMNSTSDVVNAQISGLNELVSGGNKLNEKQLADQLDILADKQAADMEGQRLAAQLAEQEAARAASGSGGSSKEKEEANEKYRQLAVWNILNNIDPSTGETLDISDGEKSFILDTLYDVKDAGDVVKGFNPIVKFDTSYLQDDELLKEDKLLKKYKNNVDKAQKKLNSGLKTYDSSVESIGKELTDRKIKKQQSDLDKAKTAYEEALNKYQTTNKNRDYIANLASMPVEDYYKMIYNKK